MATICQLHADLRYYLCMEPVDMRKQFQGLQGIVNVSKAESSGNLFTLPRPGNVTESNAEFGRYLTQDEGTFTTASGDSPVPVRTDGHRQSVLFIGKSRKMVKILHRESNGLTMYVRKLATGRFRMPELNTDRRTCTMNYSEFVRLILGEKWEIEGHFDENGRRLQTA